MTTTNAKPPDSGSFCYVPSGSSGGFCAINPQALGISFGAPCLTPEPAKPELAIVNIRGPLTYEFKAPECFDTYDFIRMRFDAAISAQPKTIALRIGSPGGDVAGAFELARYMRSTAKAAGVRLVTHTESELCSAAYVLACAADDIFCTQTALVGSIGVIVQPMNTARAEAAQGISFAIISSGECKADGNPHVPLEPEARARIQARVDAMADVFFTHVGAARGKRLDAAAARDLQAGIRVGHAAVSAGLADEVIDFEELRARLSAGEPDSGAMPGGTILREAVLATAQSNGECKLSAKAADDKKDEPEKKEDALRASLVTASTSDDSEKAARAKRALASYDEDEKEDKDKKEAKARAEAVANAAAAAQSATLAQVAAQAAQATAELAALRAERETENRNALFASRSDLAKATIDAVRSLPFADAKRILDSFPVIGATSNPLAPKAAIGVIGDPALHLTAGSPLSADEQAKLDAVFGIAPKATIGTRMNGVIQEFGVSVPAAVAGSNAQ